MANHVYPKLRKASVSGLINLLTTNVKFVLVDDDLYTYDAAHEFLSDVPAGARVSITGSLTGKAISDAGAFSSANARFDGVIGASVESVIMFIDTGTPSTSRLVFFQDTDVVGLPVTPSGASYNLIMDPAGWVIF
jgi:hypothetical protein